MGIELISDNDPVFFGMGRDRLLNVSRKILLSSRRADGRTDDPSGSHIEVGDKALRSIADVFKLRPLLQSRFHGTDGVSALQCLDSGLLIGAYGMSPFSFELLSLFVGVADDVDVSIKCFGIFISFVVQPISALVRL